MKPFRFPLQSLRVLRGQKERAAQLRYADALRACEKAAAQVKTAGDELNVGWMMLAKGLSTGVTAMELLRTRAWCNVLELRLKDRAGHLEKMRLAVDAVWNEMLVAARDREALDRFHKNARRAYEYDSQCAEQKHFDEMAVQLNSLPREINHHEPHTLENQPISRGRPREINRHEPHTLENQPISRGRPNPLQLIRAPN